MASPETKIRITGDPKGALTAIDKVKGGLTGLSATAARLPGFTALGAAVAGIFSASAIKGVADTADAMAKLSRRTGVAIEDLSAYDYAIGLSGSSTEEFASALDKLNRNIVEAADGATAPAEAFERLGVAFRSSDGSLRSTKDVLEDVMQAFSEMPEGPERAAIAMDIFGKSGAKLASFLDLGTEGMAAMREEAERLGVIFTDDLAAASEQFNDNMARLSKGMEGLKISIGNEVIPVLTRLSDEFLDAQRAGLTFFEALEARASNDFGSLGKDAAQVAAEMGKLKARLAEINESRKNGFDASSVWVKSGIVKNLDEEAASIERLLRYYELRRKALADPANDPSSEQAAAARKLADLEKQLGEARLKYARAVGAETKKANAEQIKDAEKLRDALQKAWQESVDGARKAGEEAAALLKQAGQVKADYQKKADDRRQQDLPPEQQQANAVATAGKASDEANFYAAAAQVAAIDGRAQAAQEYAEKAKKLIEEASEATERIQDNETAAKNFERIGEAASALKKAEAELKKGEQQQLNEQAVAQQQQINSVAAQLAELQKAADGVQIKIDPEQAKKNIAELQAQIKALKDEAASVKVGTGNLSPAPFQGNGASGSFAGGGFTGWGPKYQPAGVVHKGEVVSQQSVVRQPGALPFLLRFNEVGMQAIEEWIGKMRGYSSGGLVGNLRVPSIKAPAAQASATPVVLDFGALGRYSASASGAEVEGIERALRRAALKGGRR